MGRLRVGEARRKITPPVGTDLYGYILRFGSSTGVHDPLWANFLAVDNAEEQILLVSVDILSVSEDFSSRVREAIAAELQIEKKNILIACIHTHSAPGIHLFRNRGERNKKWEEKVFLVLVEGAAEAQQNAREASVGSGAGVLKMGKNRRKQGGPVDPFFPLLCFKDTKNNPFALVASFACHPVVLDERNLLISADYVGFFRNHLNALLPSGVTTLFFSGACGDVDPAKRGSFAIADGYGKALAEEAKKVIEGMGFETAVEIKAGETSLSLTFKWIPSGEEAERIYKKQKVLYESVVESGIKEDIKVQEAFLLWAEALKEKTDKGELPCSLDVKLQCIKIGQAVILAFPFELFSSISLSLKEKSQVEHLFLVGYANGYYGYLPDKEAHLEGGYEVEDSFKYHAFLPFSDEAEDLFTKKALGLLR